MKKQILDASENSLIRQIESFGKEIFQPQTKKSVKFSEILYETKFRKNASQVSFQNKNQKQRQKTEIKDCRAQQKFKNFEFYPQSISKSIKKRVIGQNTRKKNNQFKGKSPSKGLIDKIQKNIYSRLKTEAQYQKKSYKNTNKQKEDIWNDFLRRDAEMKLKKTKKQTVQKIFKQFRQPQKHNGDVYYCIQKLKNQAKNLKEKLHKSYLLEESYETGKFSKHPQYSAKNSVNFLDQEKYLRQLHQLKNPDKQERF